MKTNSDFIAIFYNQDFKISEKKFSISDIKSSANFCFEVNFFDQIEIQNFSNLQFSIIGNDENDVLVFEDKKTIKYICDNNYFILEIAFDNKKINLYFFKKIDKLVKSNLEVNVINFINSLSKFNFAFSYDNKPKKTNVVNNECKSVISYLTKFSNDFSKLLYSLNLVYNNLSYKTEKVLINKNELSKEKRTHTNELIKDLIYIDEQFAFKNVKSYDVNENWILSKILNNNKISIESLKQKLLSLYYVVNKLIATLCNERMSNEKVIAWTISLTKLLDYSHNIKNTLDEIFSVFARFFSISDLINKELSLEGKSKFDSFSISFGFKNNKNYYLYLMRNEETRDLPMTFEIMSLLLTYKEDKYKPTYIFDYIIGYSFLKSFADLNFDMTDAIKNRVTFHNDLSIKFSQEEIDILFEYFVQKRRVNLDQSTEDYRPSFIISFINKKGEVLKSIAIDSFKKSKDKFFKDNPKLIVLNAEQELVELKKLKGVRLLVGDKMISDYFYIVNKSSFKLEKMALRGYCNISDYILSIEKVFTKIIYSNIENILIGDDLIN